MPAVALSGYSYASPTGSPAGLVRQVGANFEVKINNFVPGLEGSLVLGHGPRAPHNQASNPTIIDGSSTVKIGRRGVAYVGSRITCGDVVANGSLDVQIGI